MVRFETMRSGFSATSSFADRCIDFVVSPGVAQRVSIRMLPPSVHPGFRSPSRNAAIWVCIPGSALIITYQHADPPLRGQAAAPARQAAAGRERSPEHCDELAPPHCASPKELRESILYRLKLARESRLELGFVALVSARHVRQDWAAITL